ncbi:hypothetical protein RRG08_012379 [Elysia crispata]|uniref:Uncharacterized protein n=1 Tax=Elysia crispata TaxID=231223 RepID=A0AAE0YGS7_9GAST|nr:hypothetical protein RRG08_012379 [Elysia crispata]
MEVDNEIPWVSLGGDCHLKVLGYRKHKRWRLCPYGAVRFSTDLPLSCPVVVHASTGLNKIRAQTELILSREQKRAVTGRVPTQTRNIAACIKGLEERIHQLMWARRQQRSASQWSDSNMSQVERNLLVHGVVWQGHPLENKVTSVARQDCQG